MSTLRAVLDGPMRRGGTYVCLVGGTAVLTGFLMIALYAASEMHSARFYGPAALVTFGWLLMVPDIYRDVTVKGLLSIIVTYVLIVVGIFSIVQPEATSILPLYAGMGGLAYAAKRHEHGEKKTLNLFDDSQSQALARDTLFVVAVVLVVLISAMQATHTQIREGLVGGSLHRLLETRLHLPAWLDLSRHFIDPIFEFVEVEYYVCCVVSLFWLASDKTSDGGYIPSRWASYAILSLGLAVLSIGLRIAFTAASPARLFTALATCAIGTGMAATARRQLLSNREPQRAVKVAQDNVAVGAPNKRVPSNPQASGRAAPLPAWASGHRSEKLPELSNIPAAAPRVDEPRAIEPVAAPPVQAPAPTVLPSAPQPSPPPASTHEAPLPPWLR